jgi:hypothetical protein
VGVDKPTFEIARLKSVKWKWGRKLDEETTASLVKFKSEGLELNIRLNVVTPKVLH